MKKLSLLIALTTLVNAGGLWSLAKNVGLPKVKSIGFVVPVEGVDARGYVFEPKGTTDKQCVIIFTGEFFQLECFDKSKQ